MNKSSLVGHVVELHAAVAASRHPADNVVRDFLRARHYLGARDRRFITETLYAMLRNDRLLTERVRLAALHLSPGTLHPSSLALYAAFALSVATEPASAVLSDVRPLCTVYLREIDCGALLDALAAADPLEDASLSPEARLALAASLPEFIVQEWCRRYGVAETGELCRALNQPAPVTVRVNTLQGSVEHCIAELAREGLECSRTRFSPTGLVLGRRVNIHSLAAFRGGLFEMQDEGSQVIGHLVEPPAGGFVVDACAGGGGKTLHLAALMGGQGKLAAIEVSETRLGDIRQRIRRAGAALIGVYPALKEERLIASWTGKADAVLVDAPCSGIGAFRRNPGARRGLTAHFLDSIAETQRSVLWRYADLVRPGGRLVYSTCTLLERENEKVVTELLHRRPDFVLVPVADVLARQGISLPSDSPYLHLFPHRHGTDGFFAAVLTRLR